MTRLEVSEFGGRFEIARQIGAGGMGVVYEVFDRERGARVALKTLRSLQPSALRRFKQEFRALQDVQHRNLVHLHELIEEGGRWFFTMELIDGLDFVRHVRGEPEPDDEIVERTTSRGADASTADLERRGAPPTALVQATAERRPARFDGLKLRAALGQLALGLSRLHGAHVIHRDLKPSNILVTRDGRVVIIDFGVLAGGERETERASATIVGTAAYMAPEQARAQPVGSEADWYSVGVVLYQSLTGRLPFGGSAEQILSSKQWYEASAPSQLVDGIPEDLDRLCLELLRLRPQLRPSGAEVARRLQISGDEAAAPPLSNFVGRERELAFLRDAFARARDGRAVLVEVRGESGVGKSAVVRELEAELARAEPNVLVLGGRCYERESVPFKAVDGVIDALGAWLAELAPSLQAALLPPRIGLLARAFPVLAQVPAIGEAAQQRTDDLDQAELRVQVFATLRELLARIATHKRLVVVIDDLQWADADSMALLSEVLRSPDAPPLLFIAVARTGSERIAGGLELEPLALAPLRPDDARALAEQLLGAHAAEAAAIAREAGGHPLFIAELVRQRQASMDALPRLELDQALWSRVQYLASDARALLELIAVAGGPVAQELAARIASSAPGEFLRRLSELRAAHFIRTGGARHTDSVETYHDRVREAVLAHLSPEASKALHRRLAVELEATGRADADSLLRHWLGAGERTEAARYAVLAADRAAQALAFDRAVQLYRQAIELRDGHADRALHIKLGEALVNAGHSAEAARVFHEAAAGAEAALAVDLRRRAAEHLLRGGRVDDGLELLRSLLSAAGLVYHRSPSRVLLSLLFHRARLRLRGLDFRPRAAEELTGEELLRIDTAWSAAIGLSMFDIARGADFQAQALLSALSAGEPYRVARALAVEAAFVSTMGGPAQARAARLNERALEIARQIGNPHAEAVALLTGAIAAFEIGKWRTCLELCDRSEPILRDRCTGAAWERSTSHLFSIASLFYLGELQEMSTRLHAHVREADERGDWYAMTNLRILYCNAAWLAADDIEGARREADHAKRLLPAQYHAQHFYYTFASAQIDLYEGQADVARRRIAEHWPALSKSMLLRVQVMRLAAFHLRARAALPAARERRSVHGVIEGDARRIEREAMPWANPLARLLRAASCAARGDGENAIALLELASHECDAAEMGLYAASARRRQGELLGGDRGRTLIAAADDWMRNRGVQEPVRMTRLLVPGLDYSSE